MAPEAANASDPTPTPLERPPGRLKAAWSVLRGERLVPAQIQWEWAEYQAIFTDLLTRHSAMLARMAKSEKKRIDALTKNAQPPESPVAVPSRTGKADLRRRAAIARGLGGYLNPTGGAQNEHSA